MKARVVQRICFTAHPCIKFQCCPLAKPIAGLVERASVLSVISLLVLICSGAFEGVSKAESPLRVGVDVDRPTVSLTFDFDGTQPVIFGVVEQDSEVVMVIRGPARTVDVRHKDSVFGLWRNERTVRFRNVPGFYYIATSRAMKGYASKALISTYNLTIDALGDRFAQDFMHTVESEDESVGDFARALISEKQALGLYREFNGALRPKPSGLFRIEVELPAYTPVGSYYAYIFVLKDGNLMALEKTILEVKRSDLQDFIATSAQEHSLAYAVFCILSALTLGFGVAWLRR